MGKGRPYSQDLRVRLVDIYNNHSFTNRQCKQILHVSRSAIRNYNLYIQCWGTTLSTSQLFGRKPRRKGYNSEHLKWLIQNIDDINNINQVYIGVCLNIAFPETRFTRQTVGRMIKEISYTRKKITIRAYECDQIEIALHFSGLIGIPVDRLYFGDEVHVDTTNGASIYGYSFVGEPAVRRDVWVRRRRASIVGVCGVNGMICHASKYGSIKGPDFNYFVMFMVCGYLESGDYYIIDNASVHKDEIISTILGLLGIILWWLPPYSPHLNPIETVWAGMKGKMRSLELRAMTRVDPVRSANIALSDYYGKDLSGLYRQCGYR